MSPRPVSAATSLIVLAVTASMLLGGCSLLPRIPILNPGGNDGGSSSDGNSSNGNEIEENPFLDNTVPEGFPAEIPLPDLEIYLGMQPTEGSWSIIYIANDLESDFGGVVEQFEADGWEVVMNNHSADGALGVFQKEPYTVQVTGAAEGGNEFDGPALSFVVVRTTN